MPDAKAMKKPRVETGIASCRCCRETVAIDPAGNACVPMTDGLGQILGSERRLKGGGTLWQCNLAYNYGKKVYGITHLCPGTKRRRRRAH